MSVPPPHRRPRRALAVLALALTCLTATPRAAELPSAIVEPPPRACDLPPEFAARTGTLANASAALRAGRLDLLAVGSATMLGTGASEEGSLPSEAAARLHAALPSTDIRLTLNIHRAATAADMLAALRSELALRHYPLVLWQTGTVEAARRLPPPEFERVLREGSRMVRAAGGDLILIDPQFSRLLETRADPAPYEAVFNAVAQEDGVTLFSRYGLIRQWVARGAIDLERAARKDRRRDGGILHACVARALARTILAGLQPPAR